MACTESELERWRGLDARVVIEALAEYAKADTTFRPISSQGTERLYVTAAGAEWELLVNGPKWFDTRARKGGGGAVDLVMHLWSASFKQAVALLRKRSV